ncbi:MAG: serine hydrolase domain-containing protein [Cyanobium sp.]
MAGSAGLAAPSAAALEAPAGWSLSRRGALSVLVPPERDSHIVVLLVPAAKAANGEQAVARLWRELGVTPPPLQGEAPLPDALGWVERRALTYAAGAGEADAGRRVTLLRQRSPTHWSLVLQDLSAANAERRAAAVLEVVGSVEAPGYQRESFAGRRALPLDGARLATLRAFVEQARRELLVPGVALAIVQKDRVVLAEGFGERKLGGGQRPDANTLFMVASTTKPLTSLMAARLVDQGRLAWSAPVRPLLPQLQLADPAAADQLQVRHLFCACSGVPRRDFVFLLNRDLHTPEAALAAMVRLHPNSAPGAVFQYSNQMAAAGGYLAARVAHPDLELGVAYDRAMEELVFRPLGMESTTLAFDRALAQPNLAQPHGISLSGKAAAIDPGVNRSVVASRPAGGVWSSANDMLRYVALELRGGLLPDGGRLLSTAALKKRWQPGVTIDRDRSYGLMLEVDRSLGIPVISHNGALLGYRSLLFWLPEHDLGAVVLTNGDLGDRLVELVHRRVLEMVFNGSPKAEAELVQLVETAAAEREALAKGLTLPADPLLAARLASHYRSPDLGPLALRRQEGQTLFDFGWTVTPVGSKVAADGAVSFVFTGAVLVGPEFGMAADGRTLEMREHQQIYRYEAVPHPARQEPKR